MSLLSLSNFLPSSTLVPSSLTTIGIETPTSFAEFIIPSAITSHLMIPPKILTKTTFTFLSESKILNAFETVSADAPPPTSKKFAGDPPECCIKSMVAIASPAPLTIQPISPFKAI